MNRRSLFFLLLVVCGMLLFPKSGVEKIRTKLIMAISPSSSKESSVDLELENERLRAQFERVLEWVSAEKELEKQWIEFAEMEEEEDFFARRKKCLGHILERELHALPAKVIFREPSSWTSTVWINVGERDNASLGEVVVAENSPVVVGKCVVGVVEKVEKTKSSVRLITDPALSVAVRVVRGGVQDRLLYERLLSVIDLLGGREDLYGSSEVSNALGGFLDQLEPKAEEFYLAKGVVSGVKTIAWRKKGQTLQGVGFNYDFADEEGEARILRSGETLSGSHASPLIQTGDLLVTSGLDGVFPADLHVAVVTKILPLREGGVSYSLEAKPVINSFKEVFVLPPS